MCNSGHCYLKKDVAEPEKVLKRAAKMNEGLEHLSYAERQMNVRVFCIEKRLPGEDVIKVYELVHGVERVGRNNFSSQNPRFEADGQWIQDGQKEIFLYSE